MHSLTGIPPINRSWIHFSICAKPFSSNANGRATCEQYFLATTWEHSHFSFCELLICPKRGHMQLPRGWRKRGKSRQMRKYPCVWWHQPIFERKPSCQACTTVSVHDLAKETTHTWHYTLNWKGHTLKLKELGSFLFVDSSVNRLDIRNFYSNAVSFSCN